MKQVFLVFIIFLLQGCDKRTTSFEKIDCSPLDSIPNSNLRTIFKPCREYIYSAKFWDKEYSLLSQENISVMATGKGWEFQPESQDEIIIQYAHDPSKIESLKQYSINPEIQHWTTRENTGIIETSIRTWMHPFRSNQYSFTEVAPFPSVQHPLYLGKTWSSKLNIYDGWGVWANTTLNNTYEVIDYETVKIALGELEAWHISSVTSAEFGISTHNFWYNEELGFIKMVIKNYEGQLLQFELTEFKDKM